MGGMVSQLLAPWMTSGAFNPADYGGTQNLGANLLAQSGPSQMPMTTAQRLGLALQGAQKSGLQNAAARQQVATGGFQLQRMMESWPTMLAAMKQLAGNPSQGAPQGMQPQGQPQGQGLPFSRAPTPANTQTPINAPPSYLAANQGVAQGAPQGSPQQSPQMGATGTDPTSQYLNYARLNAVLGMGGMSSPGLTDYAKLGLANDPAAITQKAVAGNAMTQDIAGLRAALAAGNQPLAQQYATKLRTDSGTLNISRNGIRQELGPDGRWSTFNSQNMTGSVGDNIFPLAGAVNTTGALAGAKDYAHAANTPYLVTDPKTGTQYVTTQAAAMRGGTPQAGAPASGPPNAAGANSPTPMVGGLSPLTHKFMETTGTTDADYIDDLQKQADGARQANFMIDNMMTSASGAQLGPGAGAREFAEKWLGGIGQQVGIAPPKELTKYQEVDKYTAQLGMAQARAMGSREAGQIVMLAVKNNPNKAMTGAAFNYLGGSMKALNNYSIAKNTYIQQQAQAQGGNAKLIASQWTQKIDPRVWDLPLSSDLGMTVGPQIGASKIATAMPYMQLDEQVAIIHNLPPTLAKQVAMSLPKQTLQAILAQH